MKALRLVVKLAAMQMNKDKQMPYCLPSIIVGVQPHFGLSLQCLNTAATMRNFNQNISLLFSGITLEHTFSVFVGRNNGEINEPVGKVYLNVRL